MKKLKCFLLLLLTAVIASSVFSACGQRDLPTSGKFKVVDYYVAEFEHDETTEKYSLTPVTVAPKPIAEDTIEFDGKKFIMTAGGIPYEFEHREPMETEKEHNIFKIAASAQVFETDIDDWIGFIWIDTALDEKNKSFNCIKLVNTDAEGIAYLVRIFAL